MTFLFRKTAVLLALGLLMAACSSPTAEPDVVMETVADPTPTVAVPRRRNGRCGTHTNRRGDYGQS